MPRDWIDYLPENDRQQVTSRRRRQRLVTRLRQRRVLVGVCLGFYGLWCLILLIRGLTFAFTLSLLLLLFTPLIGYLAWWLVWKEFNS